MKARTDFPYNWTLDFGISIYGRRKFLSSPTVKGSPNRPMKRWCPGGDSNPHAFRHQILNLARLPIPPPGHKKREMKESNAKDKIIPQQGGYPKSLKKYFRFVPAKGRRQWIQLRKQSAPASTTRYPTTLSMDLA